jgi:hypothetical protein
MNNCDMEDTYGEYASPYLDIDITFLFEPI